MEPRLAPSVRCTVPVIFASIWFLTPSFAPEAIAQTSDAATVSATVTVDAQAVSVTGVQDLQFGSHFASAGLVGNELAAGWLVDTGGSPASVDLAMTQLPAFLTNGAGDQVPLFYGVNSLAAECDGVIVQADPGIGINACNVTLSAGATANVALGEPLGNFPGTELVEVDLTGAPPGTYTGTLELTATLN